MTAGGPGWAAGGSTLLNGLQVYYKLEDLTDSSGNSLTLTNNNTVTFVAGKVNNCANFVATSLQSLTHADAAPFQMGAATDFTVAMWFNAASGDTARRHMFCYGNIHDGQSSIGYGFFRWNESIQASIGDGTASVRIEKTSAFDGNWHLVVATYARAGSVTLYYDNSLVTSASIATIGSVNSSSGFFIGDKGALDSYYNGKIDEGGIWNRVLTSGERDELWNSGTGRTYPFS